MKPATRAVTAFTLTLICGLGIGIGLQKYLNLSAKVGNALRKVGLYQHVYPSTAVIKEKIKPPASVPPQLQGKLKLYVLIGQSNMVGDAEIPEDIRYSANVYNFGNNYRWALAKAPIDSAENQVDTVSADGLAGFGPALTFAQTLVSRDSNQLIGLIPCAKNGSSMADWQRSFSEESLYGSCLKRVRAASTMGTLSGILFFQGESDAIDPAQFPSLRPAADAWADKFAIFAYGFRQDVGAPNLPFVYAQLGQPDDLEGLPNWDLVKQQQENIQIPNGAMIETDDLPMEGIHYTADSYKVIGQRFADAMTDLVTGRAAVGGNPNGESPPAESAQ